MKWYICLLTVFFVGCHTPQYTYKHVGTQSNDPENYQKSLQSKPIKFNISYKKISKAKNSAQKALKFNVKFTNTGVQPIIVNPTQYRLLDDEGNQFRPQLGSGTSKTMTLFPKSTVNFSIFFPIPAQYKLENVGSLKLTWSYKINNRVYRRLSKFLKREIEYRTRYHSNHHWGFGSHYGRSHRGFGLSFGFGHCY